MFLLETSNLQSFINYYQPYLQLVIAIRKAFVIPLNERAYLCGL